MEGSDAGRAEEGKGFLYSSNGVIIAILKRSSIAKNANQNPDLFIFGLPSDFRGYEQGYTKNITIKDHFTWLVLKAHTHNTRRGSDASLQRPSRYATNQFQIFRRRQRSQ